MKRNSQRMVGEAVWGMLAIFDVHAVLDDLPFRRTSRRYAQGYQKRGCSRRFGRGAFANGDLEMR